MSGKLNTKFRKLRKRKKKSLFVLYLKLTFSAEKKDTSGTQNVDIKLLRIITVHVSILMEDLDDITATVVKGYATAK